jgi:hypothetical protein
MSKYVLWARINRWPMTHTVVSLDIKYEGLSPTLPLDLHYMLDQFKFSKHEQYGHLQHRNLRHRCSIRCTAVVAMCSVLVWQYYECVRTLNKQYITHLQISVCYHMPSLLFSVPIRTGIDKSADITCTMQTGY